MKNKKLFIAIVTAYAFISATSLSAQEKDSSYGIFDSEQQYYDFMVTVKSEGAENPELMAMVPLINDIVLGQPIGSTGKQYNATGSTLGMLANESIRKELEMVDGQYDDLKRANEEIQRKAAEQLKSIDLSDFQAATAQILAIRDQSESDLQATLLPQQMKRLRQLLAQRRLRQRGLVEILTSEPMKSDFEISDDQSELLIKAEKKIEAELEKQIAELREKARKKTT